MSFDLSIPGNLTEFICHANQEFTPQYISNDTQRVNSQTSQFYLIGIINERGLRSFS